MNPKHECTYRYLWFISFHSLTSVSGVVDGSVCLDEDVPGMEGHHQYPLLRVQAVKVHRQIHKLVLRLLAIQTIRGQLAKKGRRVTIGLNNICQHHHGDESDTFPWNSNNI